MSPRLDILGNLLFKTCDGKEAISENQENEAPKGVHATDAASIPEHMLPTVLIFNVTPP